MPYRRKGSSVWYIEYVDASGTRVRRSSGTTDHKEAQALEGKMKADVHQQLHWGKKPERTLDEVLLQFLRDNTDKKSRFEDIRNSRKLRELLGKGRGMQGFRRADVADYIDRRRAQNVGNATINRELALLSAALNHCNRREDWGLPNPVPGMKLKEPEGRTRWLRPEEAERLLAVAYGMHRSPHLGDFILLALTTGMRRNEMLGLEWSRVDLRSGLIHLGAEHTKSGKRRSVPINDAARRALVGRLEFRNRHCPTSPWVFCHWDGNRLVSVRQGFEAAVRRAGIENFRIHDLRHTCASWMVQEGAPLGDVRDFLGHSTVTVTERYAHHSPDRVRAAASLLNGRLAQIRHSGVSEERVTGS